MRLMWIDSLPERVQAQLPLDDVLAWIVREFPERSTADILAGFSGLVFHKEFRATFSDGTARCHQTADGEIESTPVLLTAP